MANVQLDDTVRNRADYANAVDPAAPSAGRVRLFSDTDKRMKAKNEDSTIYEMGPEAIAGDAGKFIKNVGGVWVPTLPLNNYSTAAQTPVAETRTYITGSGIVIPAAGLAVGTMFRWIIDLTKTAAGTAVSTFDIAFGTNGTTADTARVSFTKPAGSAAADCGRAVIEAIVRGPVGAAGVVVGHFLLTHNLAATGHAQIPCVDITTISAAFDIQYAACTRIGICITTGAADAITIEMARAETFNL